jgi:hypothetical protein
MTLAQRFKQIGRDEGLRQGRQEGLRQGRERKDWRKVYRKARKPFYYVSYDINLVLYQ